MSKPKPILDHEWHDYSQYDRDTFPKSQGHYTVELKDGSIVKACWNGSPMGFGKVLQPKVKRWKRDEDLS